MEGTKYKSTYNFMTTIAPITMTKQILVQGEGKGRGMRSELGRGTSTVIKYVNHSFKMGFLCCFVFVLRLPTLLKFIPLTSSFYVTMDTKEPFKKAWARRGFLRIKTKQNKTRRLSVGASMTSPATRPSPAPTSPQKGNSFTSPVLSLPG